jgi:dTDP-4-dehydrorhamnose 3,5-epimerase-like enzyme
MTFISNTIDNISKINFNKIGDENYLLSIDFPSLPFAPIRVFSVISRKGSSRGNHAHISCNQLIICISGSIAVKCDDGNNSVDFILYPGNGLLVPCGIWASQDYLEENSIINVFCDQLYDEEDYLRSYKIFLQQRLNK